jgi:SAM-dependent methyltransferase
MEARRRSPVIHPAERFFRESDYWKSWSLVPDLTVDIDYALRAVMPGDRAVLDVPCGRGRLLKAVARRAPGAALYGLDVNRDIVERARAASGRARVQVGSVYALPFRDRSFDVVLCNESFMHFDDPAAALTELCRVSRDRVYLSVTTRRQLNSLLRRAGLLGTSEVPHWTWNVEELTALLPDTFRWSITGAVLVGRKALRVSHATHRRLHRWLGRFVPQPVLRRFGQTLFAYGRRK